MGILLAGLFKQLRKCENPFPVCFNRLFKSIVTDGIPPTSIGTPLFFSAFLLVSNRDATKGITKPMK
jgi:hypothetical protein